MVSCARPANKVQTMTASSGLVASGDVQLLWSGHGGTVGATNVVSGRLPMSGTIAKGATESGFTIHTAPLVYRDSNGVQHVFALWANTSELKLVKYEYSGGSFAPSNDFGTNGEPTFTASPDGFKAHQIALAESTGGPVIFIAHANGIHKYNAMSGETIATYVTTNDPVFRLLVHNGMLYAQSSKQIFKFNVSNVATPLISLESGDYTPKRALPLVVSGDYIYFEHDNDVKRTSLATLNSVIEDTKNLEYNPIGLNVESGTKETERRQLAHNLTVDGSTIGALAAYKGPDGDHTVIYSVIAVKDSSIKLGSANTDVEAIDTAFYVFDATPNEFFSSDDYEDTYCDRFKSKGSEEYANRGVSFCGHGVGSTEHTAMAVDSSTLYLPGWSSSDFAAVTPETQVPRTASNGDVQTSYGATLVSASMYTKRDVFHPHAIQHKGNGNPNGDIAQQREFRYFPTTRFVVHDTDGRTLAIAHVSEFLKDNSSEFEPVLFSDGHTLASRNDLNNYHSRILLGNQTSVTTALFDNTSMHVHSFSVGDGVVFMGGSDNALYYLK